jgi:hypothetical protein
VVNEFLAEGLITEDEADQVMAQAAESRCGAVLVRQAQPAHRRAHRQ